MKGGYILIDCKGLDLTKGSTEQTIEGLYAKVTAAISSGKMIIAQNLTWGSGKPVTPINVFAIDFTDNIICTASTLQIVVTPADKVTIVNMAPTQEG